MGRGSLLLVGVAVLAAWAGGARATPRTVPLKLTVHGAGALRVGGKVLLRCNAGCSRTVRAKPGKTLVFTGQPAAGWKLTGWTGACAGAKSSCSVRPAGPTRLAVTFIAPGSFQNPVPRGVEIDLGWGVAAWHLKINSVVAPATEQVLAVDPDNPAPAPGLEDVLVLISAINRTNGGEEDLWLLQQHIWAAIPSDGQLPGAKIIQPGSCGTHLPPPDLLQQGHRGVIAGFPTIVVPANHTVTGYICFQVPLASLPTLKLFVEKVNDRYAYPPERPDSQAVWFALR